jgi:hypothetical protein
MHRLGTFVLPFTKTNPCSCLRDFISFAARTSKIDNLSLAICCTHLSDDSDESYRSVQRFFRSESAESSSTIELKALSCGWVTAAVVIGIIEISFNWSAPFVCFVVVCIRCDMFDGILLVFSANYSHIYSDGLGRGMSSFSSSFVRECVCMRLNWLSICDYDTRSLALRPLLYHYI